MVVPRQALHSHREFGGCGQLERLLDQLLASVLVGQLARFDDAQQGIGGKFGRRGAGEIGDGAKRFGKFRAAPRRTRIGNQKQNGETHHLENHDEKFTMAANDAGSKLAPPTSAPSISSCAIRPRTLSGFTLPP